jgi:hypothetical protein
MTLDENVATDEVQTSVLQVLNGDAEAPEILVDKIEQQNPGLPRDNVKGAIISLLNRGILELTLEGRLRLGRK